MILNEQPCEAQVVNDGILDVVKVWDTIQGEGPYAGWPATFVRLAGCNLLCPCCDTDYTSGRNLYSVLDLIDLIPIKRKLVVLTGGEPFRQQIEPLCWTLLERGHFVQIETNGTLYVEPEIRDTRATWEDVTIVCSPKTPELNPDLAPFVDAYKYIVQKGYVDDDDGLPTRTLGRRQSVARPVYEEPIYIQPLDEGTVSLNRGNIDIALASVRRFGYILCLQQHKMLGLE